ncbi:alpha/beta hydrolase [Nocardia sp. alder85J]|uniref:alpha/beta hydrolase n=1 Tax=Nocardia sp. alder85J TaxID=2862949 RepID=UPI001CD5C069|nr:alpha/beta hydrolase family protein [Nocardia sp. alder85J]MCX4091528.1 alpha/beta hydrolase family protein [Nocardia sp. alder85J]
MRLSRSRASLAVSVSLAVVLAVAPVVTGSAAADPATLPPAGTSADGSRIDSVQAADGGGLTLQVFSAAMNKDIEVFVQRPADTSAPAPTLYLLNGAGGGEDTATWNARTDALGFLGGTHVNVVEPIGGQWSYYTDWRAPDPKLGVNRWKTFLTEELPPLIDRSLGATGVNAIAGVSMSGTSVLQLPIAAPGLYRSVASLSGCAQISDHVGHDFVTLVLADGGGDPDNMYGPQTDPMWAANDPYVHADQLRGLNLFISNGSGAPGRYDTLNNPYGLPGPGGLANQVAVGGVLETATDYCAHNLQTRLTQLGIPATYDFQPTGTHSWGYWQDELKKSWPTLARGLGLPEN